MRNDNLPQVVNDELIQIEAITDRLGMPVDNNVQLTVAALRCLDFKTYGSCGGHPDRITTGPYIKIVSGGEEPLLEIMQKGPRTGKQFIENRQAVIDENYRTRRKLYKLLEEFYSQHEPNFNSMLVVKDVGPGRSDLCCNKSEIMRLKEYSKEYPEWLKGAQKEFKDFTEFLIARIRHLV